MKRLAISAGLAAALLAGSAASALGFTNFVTPSRNISCVGTVNDIRCDIRAPTTFTPPAKPRSCDLDWGDSFGLRAPGRGHGICHGDTTLVPPGARARVLRYGTSIKLGRITCTSHPAGLSCRNRAGHGLFLSKQRLLLY